MVNGQPVPTGVYCDDLKPGCASPAPTVPVDSPFWKERKLTEDWGGWRTALSNKGISLQVTSTTVLATVVSGGRQQGFLSNPVSPIEEETHAVVLAALSGTTALRLAGYARVKRSSANRGGRVL